MTHDFDTIDLTRTIAARPETVHAMWSDPAHKEAWFMSGNGPEWTSNEYTASLAEGGTERAVFSHDRMGSFTILSHVLISQPPHRFIYAYRMDRGDTPITASLVTISIRAADGGSTLRLFEQITFIDGGDTMDTRLPGTIDVLDKMQKAAESHERTLK